MKHLITANDLTAELRHVVLQRATEIEANGFSQSLQQKIVAHAFFEPSTRTRLSFEAATLRSGGNAIGFSDAANTSTSKGETLEDTIQILAGYADAIVMRHPEAGSAARAAAVSSVPVINAGDGANAHPTQTLVDLFAIQQALAYRGGALENFTITMVGDLKYSRVAHSLAEVLSQYPGVRQIWVSPSSLAMPEDITQIAQGRDVNLSIAENYESFIPETDILMVTRVQEERFTNKAEYEALKDRYILQPSDFEQAKPELKILSPLPRRYELPTSIDPLPYAYYFQQAKGGVAVRAALLEYLLS